MSASTSLVSGGSSELMSRWFPASTRAVSVDVVRAYPPRSPDARPRRIGGAPLAGAQAVTAYQRTAALDALVALSRIDERA